MVKSVLSEGIGKGFLKNNDKTLHRKVEEAIKRKYTACI